VTGEAERHGHPPPAGRGCWPDADQRRAASRVDAADRVSPDINGGVHALGGKKLDRSAPRGRREHEHPERVWKGDLTLIATPPQAKARVGCAHSLAVRCQQDRAGCLGIAVSGRHRASSGFQQRHKRE